MAHRAGSADLPLHGGRVPKWLGDRMTRLGTVITQAIVHEYGRDELLCRLAHPFCFQSFGAVMGMDIAAQVRIPAHRPRKTRRLPSKRATSDTVHGVNLACCLAIIGVLEEEC